MVFSMIEAGDPLGEGDDFVASFQLENSSVRGRATRLGDGVIDPILKRHNYPRWAAHALGEALTLAVLISASLKFEGRISVQAEGDGPISMLVAEARTDGGVRGYLKLNQDKWDRLMALNKGDRPHVPQMIGKGVLGIVLIQDDPSMQPYQGVVPLDGADIAQCAEHYFAQSEQIPTRVRLSVAELEEPGGTHRWRSGGAILQQVAGDMARGETDEDWNHARTLFETVTDAELADPDVSTAQLLYRLFHEDGVRLEPPSALRDACTCSEERLKRTLAGMPPAEIRALAEDDGMLVADCQFCGRIYRFAAEEVVGR
ncbi:MAG: Hsp33 family molecular chaperone HslO [Pseudomonadota bacterium]